MKLKEGFMTHESMGEQIMVATGKNSFSGLVRSNRTAAFIVDCLKKETTKEGLLDQICGRYDVPRETAARDLENVLNQLREIGALDE
jgi:hypothetical protein